MKIRIKRLYLFMLQTFLPQFLMTFLICLFIVMMQFLWRYVDELVGKGLSIDVVAELFFYAALTMVPLALPLAILLASLMTFGNLGEHVELTAMKSSGISLLTVFKPLMIFIALVAVGAFFFQNNVLPKSQVKMWTLLFSMRQKSPTLDIPEGAVYTQIPGYNLYVKRKGKTGDMLYNVLIYDVSMGTSYPRVVAADSGRLSLTEDKQHIVLNLYKGEWYEDMRSSGNGAGNLSGDLYRRESFHDKEILIPYDDNFTRMDDDAMRQQYVGKDIAQLQQTIDSVQLRIDSVGSLLSRELQMAPVCGVQSYRAVYRDSTYAYERVPEVAMTVPIHFDSIVKAMTPADVLAMVSRAAGEARNTKQDYEFKGYTVNDDNFVLRRHQIEMQKKFTLSLACIIFFLIGAPLGAIIRKGGLGMPIVISVILFIFYYMIDNSGYKLARDGRWPVWQGIWLSSAVLLPLGIFLTQRAVNDSAVLNPDVWMNVLRRITGMHQVRKLSIKEVVINDVEPQKAAEMIQRLKESCQAFLQRYPGRQSYMDYWHGGFDKAKLQSLSQQMDDVVDYLSNSRDQMVINKAMDYPVIRQLLTYHPTRSRWLGTVLAALLPVGLAGYAVGVRHQANLKRDISHAITVCDQMTAILNGTYDREMEYDV